MCWHLCVCLSLQNHLHDVLDETGYTNLTTTLQRIKIFSFTEESPKKITYENLDCINCFSFPNIACLNNSEHNTLILNFCIIIINLLTFFLETIPSGDIILKNGTALEIYCKLYENLEINNGLNASNLYFWVNKTKVSDKYVTIINETTIKLYDPHIKPSLSTYYCKVSSQNDDVAVCPNQVAVGCKYLNCHL